MPRAWPWAPFSFSFLNWLNLSVNQRRHFPVKNWPRILIAAGDATCLTLGTIFFFVWIYIGPHSARLKSPIPMPMINHQTAEWPILRAISCHEIECCAEHNLAKKGRGEGICTLYCTWVERFLTLYYWWRYWRFLLPNTVYALKEIVLLLTILHLQKYPQMHLKFYCTAYVIFNCDILVLHNTAIQTFTTWLYNNWVI